MPHIYTYGGGLYFFKMYGPKIREVLEKSEVMPAAGTARSLHANISGAGRIVLQISGNRQCNAYQMYWIKNPFSARRGHPAENANKSAVRYQQWIGKWNKNDGNTNIPVVICKLTN